MIYQGFFKRLDTFLKLLIRRPLEKAKPPGAQFFICLPLADNERLSEDFVSATYDIEIYLSTSSRANLKVNPFKKCK